MSKQSKLDKLMDKQIQQAYGQACENMMIDIMDISKVFAIGRKALLNGASDEELQIVLREFVQSIRKG